MFSGMKMEEYMESEHSGVFWVKLVAKNIVLGSSGTRFMHMRVKGNQSDRSAFVTHFLGIIITIVFLQKCVICYYI